MTKETTSIQQGFMARWLRDAWLGWLALVLLPVIMLLVVKPHVSQFMDYWYVLPAGATGAEELSVLRQLREQAVIQHAWLIGAAPVIALLVLQLLLTLFSRPDKKQVNGVEVDENITYQSADKKNNAAERTVIREIDPTLALQSFADKPQVVAQHTAISLDGDGALYIGQGGRYRIDRLLASGGMGSVHKGFDKTLQRVVAIKELDISLAQDHEQSERFRQEALALAGLAHPHIVPVYDLVEDNNRFWIVMELLSGGDLEDRIERKRPTTKMATSIIRAVAEGLAFAHNKGIVHRDIKPMNILFTEDDIPKLVDFGIAKLVQSQKSVVHTRDGLSLGSPTYMSPEQIKGKKNVDKRADIYALGITFYKILVGEAPFTGDPEEVMRQHMFEMPPHPKTLNETVNDSLNDIVLKMLAKDPDERFQSLEEFIAVLDEVKF
jgi:hypothetical protein